MSRGLRPLPESSTDLDPAIRPTELGGFERGMQRACGIGLGAFLLQATAVAVTGFGLYPAWWYLGVASVVFGAAIATIAACLRGHSRTSWRIAMIGVCAAGSVLTAIATSATVDEVGNAVLPLVTGLIGVLGFLDRPVLAVPLGVALVGTQMAGVAATRPLDGTDVVVVAFIQLAILVAAVIGGRLARHAAADQDEANARLVRAQVADRAAAASRSDRREQERELHDTVLSTLTALARSSLPPSERVRARCAADARYLRGLGDRSGDIDTTSLDLIAELRTMARTVSPSAHVVVDGPESAVALSRQVVFAFVRAAREAIVNALRHSGSDNVEVRVRSAAARVVVEVVDDGCGSPPSDEPGGLGVRRSIVERMADVGGRGATHHEAGAGTRVVLTWPG